MKVEGQCHCGRIAFEAEVDPDTVGLCHCADCQRLTGTAFRATIPAAAEHFRLLWGSPKMYLRVAESSAPLLHAFCRHCGTPIYACSAEGAAHFSLRVGTLEQRQLLRPRGQVWRRSMLRWVDAIAALPQRPKQ